MSTYGEEEACLHSMLSSYRQKEESAKSITSAAIDAMQSKGGYLSFSGGKDSAVVLHLARQIHKDVNVCFFQSDLEFPENLSYISQISDSWNLSLTIISTRPLLDIFIAEGWYNHYRDDRDTRENLQYVKILEPATKARSMFGDVFLWGMRANESKGRGALLRPHKGVVEHKDGRVSFAPLWNWTEKDVAAYMVKHQIPVNPLYTRMEEVGVPEKDRRVGSIFDGANIDSGRIAWLKRGWSKEYDKLRLSLPRLEEFS